MTIDFQNKREVRLLDIAEVTNHEIKVPDNLQSPIAQVLLLEGGQQIAIALADNRLAIASFDVGSLSLSNITVLENRHTATITNLRQDLAGRLISSSNAEPAAQVWQHTQGQWLHLTALSGLANNLENVLILDHNQTVGIDTSGECLLWDIDRQLQRSRMHRIDKDREQDRYVAPVQQLALGKFDGQALAIDANGVIDRWSLRDGASTTINGPRFSYIGHTPGAELVDCTVDTNGKFVVTAARLQNSQRQYLADPNATWEFCVWDTQSSTMLRRWTQSDIRADATRQTSGIEPRLSLLDQGRKLLIASDAQTRIVDLLTGQDAFVKNGFGTNFAVPCPVQDSLTLLVKRSGAIRFLDLNNVQAWNSQRVADDALRAAGDTPLKAVWTHDGKRIYMIYASGNVVQLDYNSGQIQIKWDSRAVDASVSHNSWMQALTPRNGRAASYLDIDLVVSTNAAGDQLQYAIRSGGIKSQTKHITIDFPLSSSPSLVASELVDGIHWLQHRDHEVPILVAKLNDSFEVDSQRVKVWHRSGPHTFVSSRAAQTYVMTDGRRDIQQFGRAPLRSAVGDSTGRTIYALLTDGSVWKFSLNTDNTSQWTKLEVDSSNATALTLSSDGRFLALNSPQAVEVWDVTNQSIVKRLDSAIDVVWDPRDANQKAACFPDGTLTVYDASWNVIKTISHKMQQDESVVGIQFYSETWTDPNQSPRRHLMLQTRNSSSDLVSFHAIDPPPVSSSDLEEMASAVVTAIPRNCRIVASPREGIFIVGTENGTVNVWFCMPSWGAPRQLYELVGHRGAVITAMKFTTDGKTLVTADDKNRLYAWLSQDPISN
jgi:WD40 repeat protein